MTTFGLLHRLLADARATGETVAAVDYLITLGYSRERARRACLRRPYKSDSFRHTLKYIERTSPAIARAIWDGDTDRLDTLAGCVCCCEDHTFDHCPARMWGGCRGQGAMTADDYQAWEDHYARHHGLTRAQFYGEGIYDDGVNA